MDGLQTSPRALQSTSVRRKCRPSPVAPARSGRRNVFRPDRGRGGPDPAASRRRGRRARRGRCRGAAPRDRPGPPARRWWRRRPPSAPRAADRGPPASRRRPWPGPRRRGWPRPRASASAASAWLTAACAFSFDRRATTLSFTGSGRAPLPLGAAWAGAVPVGRRDGQAGEGREAGRRHVLGQPAGLRRQRPGAVGGQRVERAEEPLPHVGRRRVPAFLQDVGRQRQQRVDGRLPRRASAARHRPRPRRAAAAAPGAARRPPSAAP